MKYEVGDFIGSFYLKDGIPHRRKDYWIGLILKKDEGLYYYLNLCGSRVENGMDKFLIVKIDEAGNYMKLGNINQEGPTIIIPTTDDWNYRD